MEAFWNCLVLMLLAFVQNISFTLVSRSRNRNHFTYHVFAATFSNLIWFLTFRQLMVHDMDWILLVPYTVGTVGGSVSGSTIAMIIERWLGAFSDDHLVKHDKPTLLKIRSDT